MCLSLLPSLTFASLAEGEDFPTSGFCGIEGDEESVSWRLEVNHSEEHFLGETGQIEIDYDYTLIISGNGAMRDYYKPWGKYEFDITEIIIEDGVTTVGEGAFYNVSSNVKNIVISDTVTSIGAYAFANLRSSFQNKHVNIPKSVVQIGERAFAGTFGGGVETFTVDPENENYTAVDGVLYSKDISKIVAYPTGKSSLSYTMPDTITGDVDLVLFWGSNLQNLVVSQNAAIICTQSIEKPLPVFCEDALFHIYFKGEVPSDTANWQIDFPYFGRKIVCEKYEKPLQELSLYGVDWWIGYSPNYTFNYDAKNLSPDGGTLAYKSSDELIATIDEQGQITINSADWVFITVTAEETDLYAETSVCGLIEIIYETLRIIGVDAELQENGVEKGLKISDIDFRLSYTNVNIDLIPDVDYTATLEFDSSAAIIYEVTLSFKILTNNYKIIVPDDVRGEYGTSSIKEGSWNVPLKTPIVLKPDEIVATSEVFLDGTRDPGLRNQETNLGDLVADAFLWQAKKSFPEAQIDATIINGGSIRMSHEAGTLTVNDIKNFLPFENYVVTVQVTGAELLELLEATTFAAPAADSTFPQVAGLTFTVNTSAPYSKGELYPGTSYYAPANPGSRVKDVKVNGQPLDLNTTYTIVTNDFEARGGDAFGVLAGKDFSDTGVLTMDALAQYLKAELHGIVTAAQYRSPAGRITIKTSSGGDSPSHGGGSSSSDSSSSPGSSYTPSEPTATVGGDGKGGEVKADRDGSVTITPDEGYQIEKITVNGKAVEIPEDGKLTGLKSSDKVEVTFAPIPEPTPTPASALFTDIEKDSWYESAVTFVTDKGLFKGVGETSFAPWSPMSRSMLMTVLARLDGQDTEGGATWYEKGMAWAVSQGISSGADPDGSVTREQIAVMLYRYAGSPAAPAQLTAFTDAGEISPWARPAMEWAVSSGVLTGKSGVLLDPQGTATRAEVAIMLQRFTQQ